MRGNMYTYTAGKKLEYSGKQMTFSFISGTFPVVQSAIRIGTTIVPSWLSRKWKRGLLDYADIFAERKEHLHVTSLSKLRFCHPLYYSSLIKSGHFKYLRWFSLSWNKARWLSSLEARWNCPCPVSSRSFSESDSTRIRWFSVLLRQRDTVDERVKIEKHWKAWNYDGSHHFSDALGHFHIFQCVRESVVACACLSKRLWGACNRLHSALLFALISRLLLFDPQLSTKFLVAYPDHFPKLPYFWAQKIFAFPKDGWPRRSQRRSGGST